MDATTPKKERGRPRKFERYIPIQVKFPPELAEAIDALAKKEFSTRSAIVRGLVATALELRTHKES